MRILQVVIAALCALTISGIASALSFVVRDVLQVEPGDDALEQED
jgi:hypothetical protein